ncbi:MAG TPA: hypothetical protein VJX10_12230 [Pseudonocardiaceae bacterium]|nr:hypothetical protein [Pseudonocardiaceae bacterium]
MTTSAVTRVCAAVGRGLLAGVAGTAAMTVSSTVEAKATGRSASTTPADAVSVVAGVAPVDEPGKRRLNTLAHWGYGTAWGVARGAIDLLGLRGPLASVAHFAVVFGTEQVILPALGVAKPTPAYGPAATATDLLHHAVYAGSSGAAYDLLARY